MAKRQNRLPADPSVQTGQDHSGRPLNKLWTLGEIERNLERLAPTAANSATVTIVGLPNANLYNLYIAAVSIASGVLSWNLNNSGQFVEGFPFNSTHIAKSNIDYMNKTVTVMIGYAQSGILQGLLPTIGSGGLQIWSGLTMFSRPINDPVNFFNYPSFLQYGALFKGPIIPSAVPTGVAIGSAPGNTPGLQNPAWNGSGAFGPGAITPAPLITPCSVPPTLDESGNYSQPSQGNIIQVIRNLFQPDF